MAPQLSAVAGIEIIDGQLHALEDTGDAGPVLRGWKARDWTLIRTIKIYGF